MSISIASLIFNLFSDRKMRKRNVLNDLLKRLRDIYLPGKSKKDRDSILIKIKVAPKLEKEEEKSSGSEKDTKNFKMKEYRCKTIVLQILKALLYD